MIAELSTSLKTCGYVAEIGRRPAHDGFIPLASLPQQQQQPTQHDQTSSSLLVGDRRSDDVRHLSASCERLGTDLLSVDQASSAVSGSRSEADGRREKLAATSEDLSVD